MKKKSKQSKRIQSLYRFLAMSLMQVFGYCGLVRHHIHVFRGPDLMGEDAVLFGSICLFSAMLMALWEYLLAKSKTAEV